MMKTIVSFNENGDSTCEKQVTPLVSLDDSSTLPTGNSWSCQQNNANNAYNVTIPSGSVNNNNNKSNSTNVVVPVAEYSGLFDDLLIAEEDCWSNKKGRRDAATFHFNIQRIFPLYESLANGTYEPSTSVCFILSYPRYREVFAAHYVDRIIHHLIAPFILSVTEVIHQRNGNISHGNRNQFSSLTAAYQIRNNMQDFKDGYVMTMDVSGFFMNIDRELAYTIFVEYYREVFPHSEFDSKTQFFLNILHILLLNDPATNCVRNSPLSAWQFIADNKSLFKSGGKGLPIGNFYSQLIANLVLAKWGEAIIKSGIVCKVTQFVDDMCVLVHNIEDANKVRAISNKVLSDIHLKLHDKKYYIQPIYHGVAFCGKVIYPNRIYSGNRTIRACKGSIKKAIKNGITLTNAMHLLSSYNSYIGFLCHTKSYNIQLKLANLITESGFNEYLYMKDCGGKIVCKLKDEYKPKSIQKQKIDEVSRYYHHAAKQYIKQKRRKESNYAN